MRFSVQKQSCFTFLITGLSVLLYVDGQNVDLSTPVSPSQVRSSGSNDDISNSTQLDNDYGYKIGSKSRDKDQDSVTTTQIQDEYDPAKYGGKLPLFESRGGGAGGGGSSQISN